MKHLSRRRAFSVRAVIAASVALLTLPAVASADIGITRFWSGPVPAFNNISGLPLDSSAPNDPTKNDVGCGHINPVPDSRVRATQAGATTDFCVSFTTDTVDPVGGEDLDHTIVELPVGSLGEIDVQAKCSEAQFDRHANTMNACPGRSQVGTGIVQIILPTGLPSPAPPTVTRQAPARVYALDTPGTQAAKLGVALLTSAPSASAPSAPVLESKFFIDVTQEGTPTIGLLNTTDQLARTVPNPAAPATQVPLGIQATSLRFWGSAAAHPHVTNPLAPTAPVTMAGNFFRVGTTCSTEQTVNLTVVPYPVTSGTTSPTKSSSSYNLSGCEQLGFDPSFAGSYAGDLRPGGYPSFKINIAVPEGNQDLGGTRITMPQGIVTDLERVQTACPVATFNAGGCPDSNKIGTVNATLSGIDADVPKGDVYMVRVPDQTLPAVGLAFKGRLPLRVYGITTLDAGGRIVNTFTNLPSLPQRTLEINLFGGNQGILKVGTALCTPSAFEATLTGQAGRTQTLSTSRPCYAQGAARILRPTTSNPRLFLTPMAATGKRLARIEVSTPPGLTWRRNRSQSGITVTRLQSGVTGNTGRWRKDKRTVRFTFPEQGTNTAYIVTKSKSLITSRSFRGRETPISLSVKVWHTDGTTDTFSVPMVRDDD